MVINGWAKGGQVEDSGNSVGTGAGRERECAHVDGHPLAPDGPEELALVEASGWREWPPRLPDQPIFYPVLNEDYAIRIARDWNVKASGVGYVTRFDVDKEYRDQYDVQQAGGQTILEYWIPAEGPQRVQPAHRRPDRSRSRVPMSSESATAPTACCCRREPEEALGVCRQRLSPLSA